LGLGLVRCSVDAIRLAEHFVALLRAVTPTLNHSPAEHVGDSWAVSSVRGVLLVEHLWFARIDVDLDPPTVI
jgi:hypothetical protein